MTILSSCEKYPFHYNIIKFIKIFVKENPCFLEIVKRAVTNPDAFQFNWYKFNTKEFREKLDKLSLLR